MLPAVFAVIEKFVSFVESGPLWAPHDAVDLRKAQSADLCGGVEGGGPGDDVPGDVIRDVHVLEVPDMATEFGCCSLFWVFEV